MAALAAAAMTACSEKDPDREAAQAFADRAKECLDRNDAIAALALMDSVDILYPQQIEVRRYVTSLRPLAMQQAAIANISVADSLICDAQMQIEELTPLLKHISGGELEGYYVVANAYDAEFTNKTGFEARINDHDFNYYIVANNQGKQIGINQVSLFTDQSDFSSQAIPDGSARSMAVEGTEIASFLPEEVYDLGQWAAVNASDIKGGMLYGKNGNVKVSFKPAQAQAIGTAWKYARAKQSLRSAMMLREKLDRQLQIARDHEANHPVEETNAQ